MTMTYKEKQKQHQINLLSNPRIFIPGTEGYGVFRKRPYLHILKNGTRNLYLSIIEHEEEVCKYFENNDIQWWGGKITGNLLSSQIACLNHLFSIRKDKDLVLKIIQGIDPDFVDVFHLPNDTYQSQYISFEVVAQTDNFMNEGKPKRGAKCTSIDALIIAQRKNGEKCLIPIEWKYTEQEKSNKSENETRHRRYDELIEDSKYLRSTDAKSNKTLYKEPYYELMRQTLWAELIVKNEANKWLNVTDFLHLHVVPKDNTAFRGRNGEMEEKWKSCLEDPKKYKLIDPSELFEPIKKEAKCQKLIDYLNERYWK